MTAQDSASPARSWRWWLATGALVVVLAGLVAFFWPDAAPPHEESVPLPPLTTSPFLNTRPDVAYVGDQGCVGCHRDHGRDYRQHPMGRSLFHAATAPPVEQLDEQAGNPFQVGPFRFQVLRDGPRMLHKEWCQDAEGRVVAELQTETAYAVGSGTQARSYFHERDGFLFMSPITWYSQKEKWDLSPGYQENPLHFHRRIESRCLYCHAQEVHPVEHTTNRYRDPPFGQLAIGCERCHGPGELHVASRTQEPLHGEVDYTIVNPRHLPPALREAVCEQCHLQGEAIIPRRGRLQEDYRPGLPLHEYFSVFVRPPESEDATRIVSHVEQMYESACFKKSNGKFGCTSCHDPHGVPPADDRVSFYRQRCQACHAEAEAPADRDAVSAPDCSLPLAERNATAPRDHCLACHMPRNPSSSATHLAVTDHRVLRRPDQPRPLDPAAQTGGPLRAFHRHLQDPKDEEQPRDLGLGLIHLADQAHGGGADQISAYLSRQALPLLDRAVLRAADDIPALEALGFALTVQGRPDEALRMLDRALILAPDREQTLTWATEAAFALGQLERAEQYCRRLTEKYPHYPLHHETLAFILAERKAWPQALHAARTAVRGNPFRPEARELLLNALLETGDLAGAQAEFDALGVLSPEHQARLRPRVAGRLKR